MFMESSTELRIEDIIRDESIIIYFQPIVSVKKRSLIGVEALCRGNYEGKIIPPGILFDLAKKQGLALEFDRLCRKKAIEYFAQVQAIYSDIMLFLNIDASVIDRSVVGSDNLFNMVMQYNLNPNNITIEINESKVYDMEALKRFIDIYRNRGFIIALDDIGAGHSNLDRLAIVKPDIIKVDMMLVSNIDKEFYKQEVLKSLVNLAKKIGALVVAEGIETEEEAVITLDFGADMLQGYYFSKPQEFFNLAPIQLREKNRYIASRFKSYALNKANDEKQRRQEYDTIIGKIVSELSKIEYGNFDCRIRELVNSCNKLECIYILNQCGIQVTDTACNEGMISEQKRPIFRPAPAGTDHSLKSYHYLVADVGMDKYITEPYISLATGNLCTTISTTFRDAFDVKYVLCIDVNFAQ